MPALNYNANDERIRFLFRWRHTVLPMVVRDPVFWLLQGLHCFMLSTERKLIEEGRGGELPFLDWRAAMVTTSLLTFFVVFYTSSCYDRYQNLFDKCIGIGGCVAEWAYLIRAHFDQVSPAVKWNLLRLILGAQQIHYAYLGGDEAGIGDQRRGLTEAEWRAVRRHNFLTRDEIKIVSRFRGAKANLPVVWALAEVRAAIKAKLAPQAPAVQKMLPRSPLTDEADKTPKKLSVAQEHEAESALLHKPAGMLTFQAFEAVALRFRGLSSSSLALLTMPVPYAYYHLLRLLNLIALSLISLSLVEMEEDEYAMALGVFFVICTIMIGIQKVAVAMSDPFGSDDLDFDLDALVGSSYDNAIALIVDQRTALHEHLPASMETNPLANTEAAKRARTWAELRGNNSTGLVDETPTPRNTSLSGSWVRKSQATPPGSSGYQQLQEADTDGPPPPAAAADLQQGQQGTTKKTSPRAQQGGSKKASPRGPSTVRF